MAMVRVRIKRMGKQWAACGVPVYPPPHLQGKPSAKRLCPKLVPGQVIEVPDDHNLINQDCVEVVRRIEKDEFLRPWAFKSAEEALMANPSKSRLGADQIANGLNLAAGARDKGRKALEEREAAREEAERLEREERVVGKRRPADVDDFYDTNAQQRRDGVNPLCTILRRAATWTTTSTRMPTRPNRTATGRARTIS